MKTLTLSFFRVFSSSFHRFFLLLFLLFFGASFFRSYEIFDLTIQTFSDAYIGVSVFVGFTFLLFYGAEFFLNLDTEKFFQKNEKWHIPISALLGALPGCGGAILVITQFVTGRIGFGSVVAVLTSTMGDAAFLLLAQEPQTALLLFAISLCTGVIFGFFVQGVHGKDFLRGKDLGKKCFWSGRFRFGFGEKIWIFLFFPGFFLGLADAFQFPLSPDFLKYFGFLGGFLSLVLWGTSASASPKIVNKKTNREQLFGQIIFDTNFVFVWVFFAFLIFEIVNFIFAWDLQSLFSGAALFMPLLGVLIGFLPGCGPQILVTTAYLSGIVPFSMQLSNAISSDGDALFPALALAPRVALFATLYTAIPALIVGYGWYFFAG